MFHRTPSLFLRPPFPEDRDAIIASMGGAVPESASILQGTYAGAMKPVARQLLVIEPEAEGAPVVGVVSLLEKSGSLEIVLRIGERFRGRGFEAEVLSGLLQIAQALGFQKVITVHCTEDAAADWLLQRSGLHLTGALARNDDCCPEQDAMLYHWAMPKPEPLAAA